MKSFNTRIQKRKLIVPHNKILMFFFILADGRQHFDRQGRYCEYNALQFSI